MCYMFKSKCILWSQHGKQMKNSRRSGLLFVICIQEVKKLVLSMFTLIVFTHSLEWNTQASFAYERSSAMKIDFMFSSFNWITAGEMIFWKNHISFLCIPLFKLFIKHFVFFWNIIQTLKICQFHSLSVCKFKIACDSS